MYLFVHQGFEPVYDQVQMASATLSKRRRVDVISETNVMAGEPRSINDIPNEIMLKILSHFGPEELCFTTSRVSKRWNKLSKDKQPWERLSYRCDDTSDIDRVVQVRCATVLGFRTN